MPDVPLHLLGMTLPELPRLESIPVALPGRLRLYHPDGSALDLSDPPAAASHLLNTCDGRRRLDDVLPDDPCTRAGAQRLLAHLQRQGHLSDGRLPSVERVALVGTGVLGTALACGLAAVPIGTLSLIGCRVATVSEPMPVPPLRPHVVHAEHWLELAQPQDLVIVAAGTVEPDRALTRWLQEGGQPHLIVRGHGDHAAVGPWWDGSGACMACMDSHRVAADPAWAHVLACLSTRSADPSAIAVHWSTAQVLSSLHGFARTGINPLRSAVHSWDARRPGSELQRWVDHPDCLCNDRTGQLKAA